MNFIEPDFNNCNLNISATLAEFLGAPNNNSTIKELKEELNKYYKNIVFICFDGLGINPININLDKGSFLRKHIIKTLVSTFPSTTTNATTSLMTNTLPLEHGFLGWSLYFKKLGKNVDIFLGCDSETGEDLNLEKPLLKIPKYYFDQTKSDYKINTIFPSYVKVENESNNNILTCEEDLYKYIKKICYSEGKQFIYAYFDDPDSTMHNYGVSSPQAKIVINNINNSIEKLSTELKDTLLIITADHGQIDIKDYVEFYKDKEIMSLLKCHPFLDGRTPAFIVKEGQEENFEKLFKLKYGEDFKLYKTDDLVNKGYFGCRGDKRYLLGDYIAIGTYTNKLFLAYENKPRFLGHHTSLTDEMEVPLILIGNR